MQQEPWNRSAGGMHACRHLPAPASAYCGPFPSTTCLRVTCFLLTCCGAFCVVHRDVCVNVLVRWPRWARFGAGLGPVEVNSAAIAACLSPGHLHELNLRGSLLVLCASLSLISLSLSLSLTLALSLSPPRSHSTLGSPNQWSSQTLGNRCNVATHCTWSNRPATSRTIFWASRSIISGGKHREAM